MKIDENGMFAISIHNHYCCCNDIKSYDMI